MSEFTIEIVSTSSPNIKKFNLNSFLTQGRSYEFLSAEDAQESPLALKLFQFPFVQTVYISQNFVAIEKQEIISWTDVEEALAEVISEYLNSGNPVIKPKEVRKTPTTVYVESTPNPAVMKFITNRPLVESSVEFKHVSEARHSPLAKELFSFPFVKEVFFNKNYISIMKFDMISWGEITMEIREFLQRFLQSEKDIIASESNYQDDILNSTGGSEKKVQKPLTPFETRIVSVIDEYIIPAVAQDGGNIEFNSFDPDTKTVRVILQGACSGCPSSTVTLKNGIERLLKQMIGPEIENVEAING